jgi:hypothetical protein
MTLPTRIAAVLLATLALVPSARADEAQVIDAAKTSANDAVSDSRRLGQQLLADVAGALADILDAHEQGAIDEAAARDQMADALMFAVLSMGSALKDALREYDAEVGAAIVAQNGGAVPKDLQAGQCGPTDDVTKKVNDVGRNFDTKLKKIVDQQVNDFDDGTTSFLTLPQPVTYTPTFGDEKKNPFSESFSFRAIFLSEDVLRGLLTTPPGGATEPLSSVLVNEFGDEVDFADSVEFHGVDEVEFFFDNPLGDQVSMQARSVFTDTLVLANALVYSTDDLLE